MRTWQILLAIAATGGSLAVVLVATARTFGRRATRVVAAVAIVVVVVVAVLLVLAR